jgi:hypothetical protein
MKFFSSLLVLTAAAATVIFLDPAFVTQDCTLTSPDFALPSTIVSTNSSGIAYFGDNYAGFHLLVNSLNGSVYDLSLYGKINVTEIDSEHGLVTIGPKLTFKNGIGVKNITFPHSPFQYPSDGPIDVNISASANEVIHLIAEFLGPGKFKLSVADSLKDLGVVCNFYVL